MTIQNMGQEHLKQPAQPDKESKEFTFKCKCCGQTKSWRDSRRTYAYFPPAVVCSDCEKYLR